MIKDKKKMKKEATWISGERIFMEKKKKHFTTEVCLVGPSTGTEAKWMGQNA